MEEFVKKYQLELFSLLILGVYLVTYIPLCDETITWCMTPYALSYKYGFISRGLIGSIIRLFIPGLALRHIYAIVACAIVILCGLTIYFVHRVNTSVSTDRNGVMFTMILFLVNPGSIAFLFYWGNYGRFDMFMIMILMVSALLMVKGRGLFLIPVLSVVGIFIHQAYIFMYFPALIVLLLYLGYVKKQKTARRVFWITGIVTCLAFLYMQFFGGVVGYDYGSMMADLDATTDLPEHYITEDMMVRLEYFTSVFATIHPFVLEPLGKNLFKIFCVFVLIFPMLYFFGRIWKDFMSEQRSKLLWLIPWSGLIGMIPKFLMTNDYGRDFSALILSQFIMMFTLLMLGDAGMKKAMGNLHKRIQDNGILYGGMLVYMASLGKFEAANILPIAQDAYVFMEQILEKIFL